jgi:hypothetical protein
MLRQPPGERALRVEFHSVERAFAAVANTRGAG